MRERDIATEAAAVSEVHRIVVSASEISHVVSLTACRHRTGSCHIIEQQFRLGQINNRSVGCAATGSDPQTGCAPLSRSGHHG